MSQSMGMTDFFRMEASEYLERLDRLVSPAGVPEPHAFAQLVRAIRGSAIMAGQHRIGAVAGALESIARGLRDGTVPWSEATRQLSIRAVDDLKVLVRALDQWTESEEARANAITNELHQVAGASALPTAAGRSTLDAGTKAFVAREGAAVGHALDQAARFLSHNPTGTDALDSVIRAMQPIRGIASLSDLPPLPDLFDGIDQAVTEVKATGRAEPSVARLFEAAAQAVSRAAREISTEGQANADSEEAHDFAKALGIVLDRESDVVPIETLFHDDTGPHVIEPGHPGGRDLLPVGQVELVAHAEHLKQVADDLDGADTSAQRELRMQALRPTLRALASTGGGPMATLTAEFGQVGQRLVVTGVALARSSEFASYLRAASSLLTAAAQDLAAGADPRLAAVVRDLQNMLEPGMSAPAPPPPAATVGTASAVPTPAPSVPEAPPPPAAPPPEPAVEPPPEPSVVPEAPAVDAAEPPGAGSDLAASWDTYMAFVHQFGDEPASLEALLAGPPQMSVAGDATQPSAPVEPAVAPVAPVASEPAAIEPQPTPEPEIPAAVAEAAPAPVAPVASEPAAIEPQPIPEPEAPPVVEEVAPITAFCYAGQDALNRAVGLRDEVRTALTATTPDHQYINELLEEVFDLVQLGIHRHS